MLHRYPAEPRVKRDDAPESVDLGGRAYSLSVSEMNADPRLLAASRPRHMARCSWFWAWALVGGAGALGLISLGPVALAPALIAGVAISQSRVASRSAFGLLVGGGLVSLFVAYVQRDGPGTTCWHTASASGCDQHLNPIPWLVVGIVLVVGGVIVQARRLR